MAQSLWVHPGTGKTGTTAIQELGLRNLHKEAPLGYFPKTDLRLGSHVEVMPHHGSYDENMVMQGCSAIQGTDKDWLLSCELIGANKDVALKLLDQIAKNFDGEVKVIITVRKPSGWYISNFSQKVKTGRYVIGESFNDFVQRTKYPAYELVDLWQKLCDDRITILEWCEVGFLEKFFATLGVKRKHLGPLNKRENTSLSNNQLQHLRAYDQQMGSIGERADQQRGWEDFKEILNGVTVTGGKFIAEGEALEFLRSADENYREQLKSWRSQNFLVT